MPSNNPVEGAQVPSFGKTYVTVYHCKDCESHICESSNYEDFVKIGETQSEIFSNEIIQLVTTETQILVCFQPENTSPGGIYAIVWEKAIGMGDSCGVLNSGGMFYWEPGYQRMESISGFETELFHIWADFINLLTSLTCLILDCRSYK